MGLQYNAYPFEFTDHIVYVLEKLSRAHQDWGYLSESIYFFPFEDGFRPSRMADYNIAQLFLYLERKQIISLIASTDKAFYTWIKTPIAGMPKMKVNMRWKIKIHDQDRLLAISKLVSLRHQRFNDHDIRCRLSISDDKLYLIVDNSKYELKKFNNSFGKLVFSRLIIHGIVERDQEGFIKGSGVGGKLKVGALVDIVRNSGFKKKARNYLFHQCTDNVIELKSPAILEGAEINHILDGFVDHNSKNDKFRETKNRDFDNLISGDNPSRPSH